MSKRLRQVDLSGNNVVEVDEASVELSRRLEQDPQMAKILDTLYIALDGGCRTVNHDEIKERMGYRDGRGICNRLRHLNIIGVVYDVREESRPRLSYGIEPGTGWVRDLVERLKI